MGHPSRGPVPGSALTTAERTTLMIGDLRGNNNGNRTAVYFPPSTAPPQ